MRALGSAARPLASVVRRAAPVSHAATEGERAFGMKQQRGAAPAARRVTERDSSPSAFPVPKSTRVNVNRRAAPVHDAATAGERAIRKRLQQSAAPCEMARDRKRVKVAQDVEMVVVAASVKMPAKNAQERLKKRLAAELDALRGLVKKAEALSGGNGRFLAAEPRRVEEAPSAKRTKTSPLVEKVKIVDPEEEEIDICGGVSPVVAIRDTSPLVPIEEVESPAPAALPPKENGSTSETVQRTEPESDSYESASSPVQSAAPKPALVMAQSATPETKVQGNQSISVLLARAKEAYEIRQQKGNGWEREKVRREVREMEKAVLPDETIHPRDLEDVGIVEFGYVLHQFGVFLRPDKDIDHHI
ncbi:hypothetical protein EJB05_20918, partial [Eragrostis curvula]